jgi:hypothetical protein
MGKGEWEVGEIRDGRSCRCGDPLSFADHADEADTYSPEKSVAHVVAMDRLRLSLT